MNEQLKIIEEIVKNLLNIMGFESEVFVREEAEGVVAHINCQEGGLLIGQGGESLAGLSHLIKLITSKKLKENFVSFSVDVNDYYRQKTEILKEFVIEKASKAAREGRPCPLLPMSSYERRIVHLALQDRKDVVCESEGEGRDRHIVIRPV